MPRYFFHVIDGKDLPDNVGTVLANAAEARAEAIVFSGAMLKDFGDHVLEQWPMASSRRRRSRQQGMRSDVLG